MRLTAQQRRVIRRAALDCFGPEARVTLFGSRADGTARGGVVFTTIQKFAGAHGVVSERSNVVVMAHEAHRWTQRESVRASLRRNVRRLLAKYGYPPDLAEGATQLVLRQAELSTENSISWGVNGDR